tara:strand:- start:304 stop:699 length:396 start_codon:yes stop_codon:yes gene_type:complete
MNLRLPNYLFLILESLYLWKSGAKNIVLTMLRNDLLQILISKLGDNWVIIFFRKVLLVFSEIIFFIKTHLIFCLKILMTYFSLAKTERQLVEFEKGWIHFELPIGYSKMKFGRLNSIDARFFNCQTFVNLK